MDERTMCNILEVQYLKMFGRKVTYDLNANNDLYPSDWYIYTNYDLKSKILLEALENGKKIVNTTLYQNNSEGVRINR